MFVSVAELFEEFMSLTFSENGFEWQLREGFLPMERMIRGNDPFENVIRAAVPFLAKAAIREICSWVVARFAFLTSDALQLEGTEFAHDTNNFGYKLTATRKDDAASTHGAISFASDHIDFAFVDSRIGDLQVILISMLAQSPRDYAKCVIRVREPESKRTRTYGWDGYSLLR